MEFIITSSLDPIKEGVIDELPRHLTIHQYFSLDKMSAPMSALVARLQDTVAAQFEPISIIGESEAEFGPNNDVRVRRVRALAGRALLPALHNATLGAIEHFGAVARNPEWRGGGYNPHIAYTTGRALEQDEVGVLPTLELIKITRGLGKKVLAVLPFGESYEQTTT